MSKTFQMYDDDLASLERLLPEICSEIMPHLNNRLRMKFRECKRILTDVRWNYGQPHMVEKVEPEDT